MTRGKPKPFRMFIQHEDVLKVDVDENGEGGR